MGRPTANTPPWHLWGNIQQVTTIVETTGAFRFGKEQQLTKVGYGRPDSWRFFFSARLISGPANTAGFFTRLLVHFDVMIGAGRSITPIEFEATAFADHAFEDYVFQWGPVTPTFPANAMIWTTEAQSPSRSFQGDGPDALGPPVTVIPAETINTKCRIVAITAAGNVAAIGQPVVVEISNYWAPSTHVRPDWYTDPPEFNGSEEGGR